MSAQAGDHHRMDRDCGIARTTERSGVKVNLRVL
jgi:hypothetical protein